MEREVIQGLIARGVPEHIAYGMAGNMAVESRFEPGINEISPTVEGSRGGYGLNQWTGPRRVQYEQFARQRGAGLDDLNTQLDFTLWELENTEKRAGNALLAAQSPEEAARVYSEQFLRPGTPHLDRRISEATRLAGEPRQAPTNALMASREPGQSRNALSLSYQGLDPSAFMSKRGFS